MVLLPAWNLSNVVHHENSSISPFLVLTYINESSNIWPYTSPVLFADDTNRNGEYVFVRQCIMKKNLVIRLNGLSSINFLLI